MVDPRVTRLAELLCTHSTKLSSSDAVLVHAFDIPDEVVAEVVRVAQGTGAKVVVRFDNSATRRQLMMGMSEANAKLIADTEKYEMERMTSYIALRGSTNTLELCEVPSDTMKMWQTVYGIPVVSETRVNKTKWVVLRWPNPGMANAAGMSTKQFEDFFFNVCTVDYDKMRVAAEPLKDLMDKTDRVRLVGPGTDLSFSIKGIGAVSCFGARNIPDGECFSCPVRDSVNGTVQYNTASVFQGQEYNDIRFVVKNGKIVEASAGSMTDKCIEVLDSDEGARYFGEWSLGYNPQVLHPMKDTLFDEKIAGSFHLTPGRAYEGPGGNGNPSSIHWDIVCIQRPEYGGGEVWFDDVLIRKDGLFVLPGLAGLNPDKLSF